MGFLEPFLDGYVLRAVLFTLAAFLAFIGTLVFFQGHGRRAGIMEITELRLIVHDNLIIHIENSGDFDTAGAGLTVIAAGTGDGFKGQVLFPYPLDNLQFRCADIQQPESRSLQC